MRCIRGLSFGFPTTLSQGITTNAGYAELQIGSSAAASTTALSMRYDDNSRFGNQVTWRMAPAWVIAEHRHDLKASAGTGFKAPALQQLLRHLWRQCRR